MRRVAVITGTRADYGYLKPLMKRIDADSEMELQIYVTGMHLVEEYGYTLQEVKNDFSVTEVIDIGLTTKNTDLDIALSVGRGIESLARILKKHTPDMSVILGDRTEALSAAVASYLINIPVVHIAGGELTFNIVDDDIRHAITKLSHLHFVSTEEYKRRVLQLGEEEWRVHRVGALSLENIKHMQIMDKSDIYSKYDFNESYPICLVVYHPLTKSSWQNAGEEFSEIFWALKGMLKKVNGLNVIIIYPNLDAGAYLIVRNIKEMEKEENMNLKVYQNLSHEEYISLLANADVLIGNTSSGIIEAPSVGTPYVCVGDRQKGRVRGENVIDVPISSEEIMKGIEKALFDRDFLEVVKRRENPYFMPEPSKRIVEVLKTVELGEKIIMKRFVDR